MNKKLQDLAWQCLPLEAKREVKQAFRLPTENDYEQGYDNALASLFGHHNLTSDTEVEAVLTCDKSKAMQLYSHLLDLVENERMSEHYSGWCDLEREYIALFGENVFADYFGSKCLMDKLNEDNFVKSEPKNEGTRQEQYAPKKMIEYLATLPRVFRIYQKKKNEHRTSRILE